MATGIGPSALIDITVKTLDGQSRKFNVPEHLNVRQFKEKISGSIEIPADNQRLIFHGRVMQDEKVLREFDIHGKAIHLVQRAPPSSSTPDNSDSPAADASASSTPPAGGSRLHVPLAGNLDVQIHLGRITNTPSTREARARLRQADFNLRLVNDVLNSVEERLGVRFGDSPTQAAPESAQSANTAEATSFINLEENMDTSLNLEESQNQAERSSQAAPESNEGTSTDQRSRVLMATDLANFLDQVMSTNQRVTSHLQIVRDSLRNEVIYPFVSREERNAQDTFNHAMEVFHALGHMMHSLSELTVDMTSPIPRQINAMPPIPFPIPGTTSMAIPIHMNVRARHAAGSRRQRHNQTPATTTSSSSSSSSSSSRWFSSPAAGTTTVVSSSDSASSSSPARGVSFTAATITNGTTPANISSNTPSAVTPDRSPLQTSPESLNEPPATTTAGDLAVMVEALPPNVTIQHIRTVVGPAGMDDDSDSSTDSVDSVSGNVTSTTSTRPISATPLVVAAAASTAPDLPASLSAPRTTGVAPSTASAFIFGPGSSMSIQEVPGFGAGQLPHVAGLPASMLQNILGSILNSHGVGGDPVQVNVVQQLSSQPSQTPQQQTASQSVSAAEEAPNQSPVPDRPGEASSNTRAQPAGATGPWIFNMPGSSGASTTTASTTTGSSTTSSTTRSIFPLAFSWSNLGSPSVSRGSDSASSRQSNNPRPQVHFHTGPGGPSRQHFSHGRTPTPGLRSAGLGSQSYVDPYLPCSSPHYSSQAATDAFTALQNQNQAQTQQQVPNLSTMVSGMVGDIIEQVGQAAANIGPRTNSSSYTQGRPATPQSSATTATPSSGSTDTRMELLNPMEMFSHLLNGSRSANQANSRPGSFLLGQNAASSSTTTTTPSPGTRDSATPSSPWTLADLFTQVRQASPDNNGEEGVNVIVSMLEAVAPHVSFSDMFSLVTGNPKVLNQVREPLQQFVARQVTQYGSVGQMVEAALTDLQPEIQHLQSLVEVKGGLDMAQSLHNCLRVHLTTIFAAIYSGSASAQADFGSHMYSLWIKMLADSIGLCIYCITNGSAGFSSMVQSYMPRMTRGMSPAATRWMTSCLQDILETFSTNHSVTELEIIRFLVTNQCTQRSTACQEEPIQAEPELIDRTLSLHHNSDVSPSRTKSVNRSSSPAPMEMAESPSPQPPRAKVPRLTPDQESETFENCPEPVLCQLVGRPTHLARRAGQPRHTAATVEGDVHLTNGQNSETWHTVVPQDWVPVISRDVLQQQDQRTQPPLSDAYLQGLPAKRRRMMTVERSSEMGNMSLYLPALLTRAAQAVSVEPVSGQDNMAREAADDLDLQSELEQEATRVLASRISSNDDFNPERFPNAREYFHKSNHH